MNAKEVSNLIGTTPQEVRKVARSLYGSPNGRWIFTDQMVQEIQTRILGKSKITATPQVENTIEGVIRGINKFGIPYIQPLSGTLEGVQILERLKLDKRNKIIWEGHLVRHAKQFLEDNFNLSLTCPIEINNRISTTMGYFSYSSKSNTPYKVSISGKLFTDQRNLPLIYKVLEHELVHYALFTLGKDFSDGDKEFEDTIKRLDGISTRTVRVSPEHPVYICKNCKDITQHRVSNLCCHSEELVKLEGYTIPSFQLFGEDPF